ncbi:MAG: Nramp family divalent metal transporter [Candidatus Woesebacteria bacterium]
MKRKIKNLPATPSFLKSFTPSFILLSLSLSAAELVLWPYLAAHYGLGLLWGALLALSFQFILNTEAMRYSLAWGESIFLGFRKMSRFLPLWFIISTLIPWSLPAFAAVASQILAQFATDFSEKFLLIFFLVMSGIMLSAGQLIHQLIEKFQKLIIFITLLLIVFFAFVLSKSIDWNEAVLGLLARGKSWWLFPKGISLASFLAAFAYAGASGGNFNLGKSYDIKEKGLGMAKYTGKIRPLFADGAKAMAIEGRRFVDTPRNRRQWQKCWHLINQGQFFISWVLALLMIVLLSVLAKTLLFGKEITAGLGFFYTELTVIQARLGSSLSLLFLLMVVLMLFFAQVKVFKSSSRIVSENLSLLFYRKGKKINLSLGFYLALWLQIFAGMAIYLLLWNDAMFLLISAAVLNAAVMAIAFPLVYFLNNKKLAKFYQPASWRKYTMLIAFIIFLFLIGVILVNFISSYPSSVFPAI